MKEEQQKKIEEIIAGMICTKGFKCAECGFEHLCKAHDSGIENCLTCLEEEPGQCPFAVTIGKSHLCYCPLRVYLAKELKK
jgi:hypothetical protein